MTVKLSNLQYNAVRIFQAQHGILTLAEFLLLDQRITSGLGKRKIPYVVRIPGDRFALTKDGQEAARMYDETDVFRKVARTTVAHVFDHATRMRIVTNQPKPQPKQQRRQSSVA